MHQDNPKKYTCVLCKKQFDKPKTLYQFDSVRAVMLNIIMIIICIISFSSNFSLGIFFLAIYAISWVIFLFSTICFGKKCCPFCKSENIYKNY